MHSTAYSLGPSLPLRLFAVEASGESEQPTPPRLSPETTLAEFFMQWFLPQYCGSRRRPMKRATVAEYRTAVARWCELVGDLPLKAITTDDCRRFVELALARPGRGGQPPSRYTVKKQCTALRVILRQAGPRSRDAPDAATEEGLFGEDRHGRPRPSPWFPALDVPSPEPDDVFTLDEIADWLNVCHLARQPQLPECSAALWWRTLILFAYNTGMRIGELLALRRGMLRRTARGLRYLDVPGAYRKQGKAARIALNAAALEAWEAMPTTDVVWPWPHHRAHLDTIRRELLTAAGLPPERRFGFHALRKAAATAIYSLDPEAAQRQLTHESRSTTEKHYVAAQALIDAAITRQAAIIEAIPQPSAR